MRRKRTPSIFERVVRALDRLTRHSLDAKRCKRCGNILVGFAALEDTCSTCAGGTA